MKLENKKDEDIHKLLVEVTAKEARILQKIAKSKDRSLYYICSQILKKEAQEMRRMESIAETFLNSK